LEAQVDVVDPGALPPGLTALTLTNCRMEDPLAVGPAFEPVQMWLTD
jgi:hypothetical protein